MTCETANTGARKSICFVSETARTKNPLLDPSARYRCYHRAEALAAQGHQCTVVSAETFFDDPLTEHDLYVFHRPNAARAGFLDTIQWLRQRGAPLIADYDDLVFGTDEIALVSSAVRNGTLTEDKAILAFRNSLNALRQFTKLTVSTAPLAERAREFNPDAHVEVVPNVIPDSILDVHSQLGTPFIARPRNTIGYFAGTRSHDKDFPVVEAALHRVLCENPDFRLLIVGPVATPNAIASLPNVRVASAVDYLRLPGFMSLCSTVIAPLEASKFNTCKSRVKYLESALSGCRLIASSIPDMEAVGEDHLTIARTTNEWYEALSTPLENGDRLKLAEKNFEHIKIRNNHNILAMVEDAA